jgi:hypothetical protein
MKLFVLCLALSANGLSAEPNSVMQMLTKASRQGDLKTAETLLSSGVDPNFTNQYG